MSNETDHFKLNCAAVARRSCSFRHDEHAKWLYDIPTDVIRSAKLIRSLSCKERCLVSEEEEKQEVMTDIFAGSNEFDGQYI